jgi:hypothetical protein
MNAAKWQVSPLLFPGIGLGLSLRVKCPARVPLAGQHSSVAVARNVLHLEAVPLTERSTSHPSHQCPSFSMSERSWCSWHCCRPERIELPAFWLVGRSAKNYKYRYWYRLRAKRATYSALNLTERKLDGSLAD